MAEKKVRFAVVGVGGLGQAHIQGILKNSEGTIQFDKGCKLVGYGEVLK